MQNLKHENYQVIRPFFSDKLLSSSSRARRDRSLLFSDLIVQLWGVIIEVNINHQLRIINVTFCYNFAPITPGVMHTMIRFLNYLVYFLVAR